jgi:hypothetical protein
MKHAKISDPKEFTKQRDLGRAMDVYSGFGTGDNEVGKFYRPSTSSSIPGELPSSSLGYTSMAQTWLAETRSAKRSRHL